MRGMLIGLVTVIGSVSWLDLLVVTRFNAAAVGAGLLGALLVTGSNPTHHSE